MTEAEQPAIRAHEDADLFREALNFTAAETFFPVRLIEKDYFCTVLLKYLASSGGQLIFKGGTCLAKVHAGFYRLSEDLDFVIATPLTASRSQKRRRVIALKNAVAELAEHVPCFRVTGQLLGANESSQYIGTVNYSSLTSRREETIAVEVSLREPLLMPTTQGSVRTLLLDPVSGRQMVPPTMVPCIARVEAIAEKYRAALTRRDVAIRDFYDVDYAARELSIRPEDTELVGLVRRKLAVPGNDPINVGPDRLAQLRAQLNARLKPVLRQPDADAFDLDRAFGIVREMAKRLPASS